MSQGEFMKEVVMHVVVMVGVFILLGAIGIASTKFLGADNPVEQEVEELMEDEIEIALKLPPESLHGKVDLSKEANQDK